jgi:transaldolase
MTDVLADLARMGMSVWLDDLSRSRLTSGGLEDLHRKLGVAGITTNPTIFANALATDDGYGLQIRELAARGVGVDEAARLLTAYDVRWAADVLRPVYDATDGGEGWVSIEIDPRLAHDPERSVAEAKALWWLIDRPNVYIKIPATADGLPAITAALAEGINVNVTLIFSLGRYAAVLDAFQTGIELAIANGLGQALPRSVASFFVSRMDTEVDRELKRIGSARATELIGAAAIANARLAFGGWVDSLATPRWAELARAGAQPQGLLWASATIKNPRYPQLKYVEALLAPATTVTLPEGVIESLMRTGAPVLDQISGTLDEARSVLASLAELGIDYEAVVAKLEREGVADFQASWVDLLGMLRSSLGSALAGTRA